MRVVHVIKVVRVAGAERHLLTLLSGLRARHAVIDARIVLLVEASQPMDDYVALANAARIPIQREVIRRDLDPALGRRLYERFRETQPDVVHTHLLHADLHAIPAARSAGVRAVVSSRHNDNRFRRRLPIRLTNAALWRLAHGGIAISESLRRFTVEVEGAPPDKMRTIPYGLAYTPDDAARLEHRALVRAELGIAPDVPVAGMVCRLIAQKGVGYGLAALAQTASHVPDARLIVAGDGVLRSQLAAQAAALGIAERVHWLGWRDDVVRVLAALDVLLMPSLWEGFGLVMLEAMSQRVPIIGSAVSAIPEVIADGETGLLVPPQDVDALAAALVRLLGDLPLARYMGLQGEERLEARFTAAQMVDRTAAYYDELLAG